LIAYLVPYLPVTPTFFVLFVILADVAVMNGVWKCGFDEVVDFGQYLSVSLAYFVP